VKLCDVSPDGTSALVTRGSLDLAYRDGLHAPAVRQPLVPGEEYDVEVELDACAYSFSPGQRLRLSVAGTDWPNTVAPPAPVTLTVVAGTLDLPVWAGSDLPAPSFAPGDEHSAEDPEGVIWSVTDDVLRRTTTCATRYASTYAAPHGATVSEEYVGEVVVDRRTFAQRATAECTFRLRWPEAEVTVTSTMSVDVTAEGYDVVIDAAGYEDDVLVTERSWREHVPR
jgi:hypothetical protein